MKINFRDIFKVLTGTGKTIHKTVKSSLEFMDDVLEKEYIINGIEDIKEATGKVVEKSGEMYAKAKMKADDIEGQFKAEEE